MLVWPLVLPMPVLELPDGRSIVNQGHHAEIHISEWITLVFIASRVVSINTLSFKIVFDAI